MTAIKRVLLAAVLAWASMSTWAAQTRVAVAANFAAVMPQLAADFHARTGHEVQAVYGATGGLVAQITHGAPFDVLLAADMQRPQHLVDVGAAVADSLFVVARGRLVLWSARADGVDAQAQVLRDGRFNKLALADPKLAPYGAAALETLRALGLEAATRPRWVMGASIGQAHQFVASGNADLGFVAMSQVLADGQLSSGSAWVVPAELHAPIDQAAVLLKRAATQDAARAWMAYLQSPPAKALMRRYGYD